MANIPVSTDINSLLTAATGTPSKDALGILGAVKKGTGDIVNADINASAAISLSKLATGALPTTITVASANIVDATIVAGDLAASAVDLTTSTVTGTLPVNKGGTGSATLTANNVLLGNGTTALQVVAPSTLGNVLTSNGTTWTSSPAATGGNLTSGPVTSSSGVSAIADAALTIAKTSGLQSVLPTPNLRGLNNTINSIAESGDGPISIIILGDSFATNFQGFSNGAKVVGSYRCGSPISGGGQTSVTAVTNDYTRSPDNRYNSVAAGGILACAHLQSGNPGPASHVYYTLFTGAGTAQFSYSTNAGSSWTNVGSAIDTSTITDVLVGSILLTPLGYYPSVICRMTVTVGNVIGWIGQGTDGPGVTEITFATTGQGIEQCADINPAIWKKMVAGWRSISLPFTPSSIVAKNYYTITTVGTTDFVTNFGASANTVGVTFRATTNGLSNDSTTGRVSQSESQIILSVFADYRFTAIATTNYPTVGVPSWDVSGPANILYTNSRALNANPSCDWFVVGPHSVDPARNDTANATIDAAFAAIGINTLNTQIRNADGAKAQREFAERLSTGFVDCIPMFPNYSLAVAEGNYGDDIHLSARGQLAKRAYVYTNSNLGWVLGSEAYRSSMRLGNVKLAATTARSAGTYALSVTDVSGINLAPIIASDLRAGLSEQSGAAMWSPSSNVMNFGFFQSDNNRRSFLSLDSNALTTGSSATLTLGSATLPWATVNTNGLRVGFVKKTAAYTIPRTTTGAQDYMIACDGTFTVTLPLARDVEVSGLAGKVYIIKNIGTGVITVAALTDGTNLQKIDNATTATLAAGATLRLISAQTAGYTSADWGNWLTW
jgi:hypothetical protein